MFYNIRFKRGTANAISYFEGRRKPECTDMNIAAHAVA